MSLLANSNAIETGGYQISRSVRLRSSASAYFNRTPASAGNRTTWTWSGWIKRGKLGTLQKFFEAGNVSTDYLTLMYTGPGSGTTDDRINIYCNVANATALWIDATPLYRDTSAWYHVVIAIDTTQATAANRIKVYVNGAQVTAFSTANYPTQNIDLPVNNNVPHYIGPNSLSSYYLDGYLTEVNFIDGQALTPSSFGETDTITGSWVAKKYTGTYGTNGFYLNFSDNSAATSTTIGKDYSGNGNNWTPNNISVTAGSTYDSMLDVPSGNGYADGGNGRGNYATLNPLNKNSVITTSDGNLAFTASNDRFVTSTIAVNSGKWYLEFSPTGGSTGTTGIGVIRASDNVFGTNTFGGSGTWAGVGYANNGQKSISGTLTSFGATYTTGSLIGVALDLDSGTQTITFYKNNVSQGTINLPVSSETWVVATNYSEAGTHTINFGQRPFSYTPPTGFKALNTTNLPTPTIGATSTTQANKYFDVVTRTSVGGTYTNTSLGFQPDWVWVKSRSNSDNHYLQDVVRGFGASKSLSSNTTGAEGTNGGSPATQSITPSSNGYSLSGNDLNTNTWTYVDWLWKANGTGSTNTAGTITSTVSANTTSGFSIVTYTGNNTSGATVGHGLGVKPAFIIVKKRTGTDGWGIYHTSLGATKTMELNTTAAEATSAIPWNNTEPTSSVIYLNGNNYANSSLYTYIMYCFAPISGYSAFGSYTGNGSSADGPFVFCGFRPAYILIKSSTDGTTNWLISDNKRLGYNITSNQLKANTSAAEESFAGGWHIDFVSNGFKVRNTFANMNGSGATYIYAAFSESPFKFSNAR